MGQRLLPYVIALGDARGHGHWGRGMTPTTALAALKRMCRCVQPTNVEYWRAYAPVGRVPYVTALGTIYSWAPPERIEAPS